MRCFFITLVSILLVLLVLGVGLLHFQPHSSITRWSVDQPGYGQVKIYTSWEQEVLEFSNTSWKLLHGEPRVRAVEIKNTSKREVVAGAQLTQFYRIRSGSTESFKISDPVIFLYNEAGDLDTVELFMFVNQ